MEVDQGAFGSNHPDVWTEMEVHISSTYRFGDRDKFALEVERYLHSHDLGPPAGAMRLWLSSQPVGDFEIGVVLGYSELMLTEFLENLPDLADLHLCGLEKKKLLDFLKPTFFYDDDGTSDDEAMNFCRLYDKFVLYPNLGEAFDDAYVVTVMCADRLRVVWPGQDGEDADEMLLDPEIVVTAVNQFLDWYSPIKDEYIKYTN